MSHSLTLRNDSLHDYSGVLIVSILAHVALFVALAVNLRLLPTREPRPVRLAIEATVVDARAMRERAAEQERAARQAEEQRRREAQRREEEIRLAAQKRAEQAEAKKREEAKRREEAEKARQARIERERKEAQKRKQAAAEAKRKAEAERKRAQSQAALQRELAREENLMAAEDAGLLDQYAEIIRQKVMRNWIRPASAREGINCVVLVRQVPGGEVVDVKVTACNGDAAVVRSIEAAVLKSSPLPPPPDPALFDRSLRFDFKPVD